MVVPTQNLRLDILWPFYVRTAQLDKGWTIARRLPQRGTTSFAANKRKLKPERGHHEKRARYQPRLIQLFMSSDPAEKAPLFWHIECKNRRKCRYFSNETLLLLFFIWDSLNGIQHLERSWKLHDFWIFESTVFSIQYSVFSIQCRYDVSNIHWISCDAK